MSVTYPKASITAIRTKIESTTKPDYGGANGVASILSNLLDQIADRGLMPVPSIASLALMSGADGTVAIVPGTAIYQFSPSAPGTIPAADVLGVGGVWRFICAAPKAPYSRVVGDASSLIIDVPHYLGTLSPTVLVYNTLAGLPYDLETGYTLKIVDTNTIRITTPAAWAGNSRTVVVKP